MKIKKILDIFSIIFIILIATVLFVILFSFLSYSLNKTKTNTNTENIDTRVNTDINIGEEKKYTELELLEMSNPNKTNEELVEIKQETENLPRKVYTEEELIEIFSQE